MVVARMIPPLFPASPDLADQVPYLRHSHDHLQPGKAKKCLASGLADDATIIQRSLSKLAWNRSQFTLARDLLAKLIDAPYFVFKLAVALR